MSNSGFITALAMVMLGGPSLLEAARSLSAGVVEADWGTYERSRNPLAFRVAIGFEAGLGLLFIACAPFAR